MHLNIRHIRRYIATAELIADLQRSAGEIPREGGGGSKRLSIRQYERLGEFNPSTIIARFGSWNQAILAAGLEPVRRQKPSKPELLENIIAVWLTLGRQPRMSEMALDFCGSKYSRHAYVRAFGSWSNALKELEAYLQSDPLPLRVLPLSKGESFNAPLLFLGGVSEGRGGAFKSDPLPLRVLPLVKGESDHVSTPRSPGIRLRMAVMKRDNFKCVLCGASPAGNPQTVLEIDHIIPWSKGGATTIDNLQTLCSECNNGKADEAISNVK